ncbi:hypothetical protein GCM10022204_43230 [Microlunatus aurantiacus]|uniref:BioF2-like acetyltransferase domain-containing protein n=1 Tax=Microlunatus aurantiacus TaxID=446786 RepID=A0ABP7EH72_9ACTN
MTKATLVPMVLVRDGHDIGVIPVLLRRRGMFTTLGCVPFPYCGPLVPAEDLDECLDLLARRARRWGVIRMTVQFSPGSAVDETSLAGHGFEVARDVTYVIDTSSDLDVLWSRLTSESRRRVRLTEKNGITVTTALPPGTLEDFERQVFTERGDRSGYDGGLTPHLPLLTGPDLRIRATAAVRDNEVLGALVTLAHGSETLGWMGGVFPRHRNTHAGYALYWDAIRWSHEIGARRLDTVGAPNEGIARFKRQFGAVAQEFVTSRKDSRTGSLVYGARRRLSTPGTNRGPLT